MDYSRLMLAGLASLGLSACAAPETFQGPMSAAYEVPPRPTPGVGTIVATVYPSTGAMSYTATYKNLSGPPTAAHFHGPAGPGANAGVLVPATTLADPITGSATLTDQQLADLEAGKVYFNIHTKEYPGGEIRGQLQRAR